MTLYQRGIEPSRSRHEIRRSIAPDPFQQGNPSSL
jgi:hypothetical protein